MDPIIQFLSKDVLPEDKSEAEKIRRRLFGSGYPKNRNCTSDPFRGHIYSAYILRHQSYFLRNYMKEYVKAIQEGDP